LRPARRGVARAGVLCAAAAMACALLGACASQPTLPARATLPQSVRASPAGYVVLTIRNPIEPSPVQAASTPRGYGGLGRYMAGGTALAQARALEREYGLQEVSSWPIALLDVHCLVYGLPQGIDADGLVARLARDPRVESVQPLQGFATASAPYNDTYAPLQKNVAQMSVQQAQVLARGQGVRVAIIDTGADLGHPDLRPRSATGRNFVDTDEPAFRADAHGTAVAGVIGAVPNNALGIVGIAPDAQLLVYKACWRNASGGGSACNSFTLAQALSAAIEAHADIINMSLNGPSDPLLERLARRGMAQGAIIVGALPRDGQRAGFPAGLAGVIVADALESGHDAAGVLRAPGRELISLAPDGHYDYYSGSSLAAAEVSGLIALLKSDDRRMDAREAQSLLAGSAAGPAQGVDACGALSGLLHRPACPAPQP
jgi:subtilisin family serine protease